MSNRTTSARAKADAEFEKVQSEARGREIAHDKPDTVTQGRDDNTARLKGLRLARDAAEGSPKAESK